jgi:hypothetical protein
MKQEYKHLTHSVQYYAGSTCYVSFTALLGGLESR